MQELAGRGLILLILAFVGTSNLAAQTYHDVFRPYVKITPAEVAEAEQWLGPEMTPDEVKLFHAWQDRIRHKYLTGPYCLAQGDGFCSAEGWYDGQFWLDTNRGEIHPVWPTNEGGNQMCCCECPRPRRADVVISGSEPGSGTIKSEYDDTVKNLTANGYNQTDAQARALMYLDYDSNSIGLTGSEVAAKIQ